MICLNTDWLGVSITLLDDVGDPPLGYTWVEFEGGTNVWSHRRVLYNQYAERVLTLLSKPKSSVIAPNAALVELDNEWLYHGMGAMEIMNMLYEVAPHTVSGISRLDLCFDFNPNPQQAGVIMGLWRQKMYVAGKRNGVAFWSINTDPFLHPMWLNKKIPHQQSWGHKTSNVKWKLYYKTKELRDAAGGLGMAKPYIVDQWRLAGLDITNVWRLEVSICHGNAFTVNGHLLTPEVWNTSVVDLAASIYKSRFCVRMDEGHADRTNDTMVPFLNIDAANIFRCRRYDGDRECSARISLLRHLVKSLDEEEVYLDHPTRDAVIDQIQGMVARDHLDRYIDAMLGMKMDDWIGSVMAKSDGSGRVIISRNTLKNSDLPINKGFEVTCNANGSGVEGSIGACAE